MKDYKREIYERERNISDKLWGQILHKLAGYKVVGQSYHVESRICVRLYQVKDATIQQTKNKLFSP